MTEKEFINMDNTKYYTVGNHTATIEKTSSGYYIVDVTDNAGQTNRWMYSTEVEALREVLSYAEGGEIFNEKA